LEYIEQAIDFAEKWFEEAQTASQLPDLLLVFTVGAAFGWFLRSLTNRRRPESSDKRKRGTAAASSERKKTKEEVELDARRRL